jgi:SAM-dependent methyltransferase
MTSLRGRLLRIRPLVRAAQFAVTGEWTPKRHRLLAAEVASGAHRSVLDLGCGSAPLLDFLAPERYVGIDAHEASLALARRRHAGVGREFIEASLADLPLDSWRGMDVVTIASVTHHLADAAVVELMERIVQHVCPQRLLVQDAHATGPLRSVVTALDDGDHLRHRDALIALLTRRFEVALLWTYDNPLRSFHQFLLELRARSDRGTAQRRGRQR